MTIREIGDGPALDEAVSRAFLGASLQLLGEDGRFSFRLHVPGLLRPLEPPEASDGTLRFLFLLAALLSPRPPPFLALNEPETSLHPDMLEPLSRLILSASGRGQIFLVTHSDALAGHLRGATVHTLQKHEGASSIS